MMLAAYDLTKYFPVRGAFRGKTTVKAVDNVAIKIGERQIVGLVGESGSGKSTLGRTVISLLEQTRGDVFLDIPDDQLATYERAREAGDEETENRIRAQYSITQANRSVTTQAGLLHRLVAILVAGAVGSIVPAAIIGLVGAGFADLVQDFAWGIGGGFLVGFLVSFLSNESTIPLRRLGGLTALVVLNVGIGVGMALNGLVTGTSYDPMGAYGAGYTNGGIGLFVAALIGAIVAWVAVEQTPNILGLLQGRETEIARMRRLRRNMNIVFQDPYSSLNPRLKLLDIITEPMLSTHFATREEANTRALELLREVGLPEFFSDRYPHELSGGQRQRVAVARAISTNPKLLILDEPTSALDVSVQAQILNMLRGLRDKYGISMLLITHNIAVVSYLAEKVYVMYAGEVMEWGDTAKVLREPEHPYTKALMSAVPIAGQKRVRTLLRGDPPNLVTPPRACRFHPRCPVAFDLCGWTADEVAEDLDYRVKGKYFDALETGIRFEAVDGGTLRIEGTTRADKVREIIAREKEEIRSLQAVRSVDGAGAAVVLSLLTPVEPGMYPRPAGGEVKCLLYRPEAPVAPPPTSN